MHVDSSRKNTRFSPAALWRRLLALFDVRNHLSAYVFVSIFVSVVIISTFLIFVYSFTVLDDLSQVDTENGQNVVDTIGAQIDSYADSLTKTHTLLFSSEPIRTYLESSTRTMPSYEWFEVYNGAREMLMLFASSQYNIVIGMHLQKNENEMLKYGSFSPFPSFSSLTDAQLGRLLFYNGHAICISNTTQGNRTNAYLFSQISDETIDSLCTGLLMPGSALILLDENENVFRQYAADPNGSTQLRIYLESRTSAFPDSLQYVENTSAKTGLTVVMLLPSSSFCEKFIAVSRYLLPLAFFALIAGFLLSYSLSRKVKRGFTVMENNIQLVENNAYSEVAIIPTSDEFGHLSRTFARMASHIDQLIAENRRRERTAHELEIQVLRAQISPHFLSNALNSVRSLAAMQGMEHIERVLTAIIRLLRAAMSRTDVLIPLSQEIEYVRNYMEICQYQYLNDIDLSIDVDESLLDCQMPPMVLQPIVENAIIHGIADFRSDGMIRICARRDGDSLILTVTDNGQGMNSAQIDALLKQERNTDKRRFSGIGLYNVLKRIQMRFGEGYGLHITSSVGEYTTVRITLPHVKERTE